MEFGFRSKTRSYQQDREMYIHIRVLYKVPSRVSIYGFFYYYYFFLPISKRINRIALTFFLLHFIKVAADFHCYCSQIISICIDKYDLYLVKLLLTS